MALRPLFPFQSRSLGIAGDPFLTLQRELNRVFDDVFRASGSLPGQSGSAMVPIHMDVTENEREIRIVAELPGVAENDIQVELHDDVLTIRGEKRSEHEDAQHHVRERSYGAFARSIQLPFMADPSRLEASFVSGVLTVSVPKEAAQQQSHRIQIKSGPSPKQFGGPGGAASGATPSASGKATNLPPGQGPSGA